MPERKNQHYVPEHYLRAWATDEITNVLPLSAGKIFPDNIGSICSRNYFYGQPAIVEKELGDLEGYHAHPINELRNGSSLTELSKHHIDLLLSFVTTQRIRTKSMKADIKGGEELLREGVKDDLEAGRIEEKIEWKSNLTQEEKEDTLVDASVQGIHHFLMIHGILGHMSIQDLQAVVLCNGTDREFIVSDAPIVHDNPRYKQERGLVRAGIGNRGLKIFCPIDRNQLLLLYDPVVYSFDHHADRRILIESPEVIDQLNLLQFHNAESIVIFDSCEKSYVQNLYGRIDEVRRRKEITQSLETESGTRSIETVPAYQIPKISPELPSCTIRKDVPYERNRAGCQTERERKLVYSILDEVDWASDLAVIYSIRLLEEALDV